MVDGLLYNEVVASTLHSTDTHGFTEVNFAVTYLIKVGVLVTTGREITVRVSLSH